MKAFLEMAMAHHLVGVCLALLLLLVLFGVATLAQVWANRKELREAKALKGSPIQAAGLRCEARRKLGERSVVLSRTRAIH